MAPESRRSATPRCRTSSSTTCSTSWSSTCASRGCSAPRAGSPALRQWLAAQPAPAALIEDATIASAKPPRTPSSTPTAGPITSSRSTPTVPAGRSWSRCVTSAPGGHRAGGVAARWASRPCSPPASAARVELASAHGCRTIAVPAISTGVYGYPVELAADEPEPRLVDPLVGRERVAGGPDRHCLSLASYRPANDSHRPPPTRSAPGKRSFRTPSANRRSSRARRSNDDLGVDVVEGAESGSRDPPGRAVRPPGRRSSTHAFPSTRRSRSAR